MSDTTRRLSKAERIAQLFMVGFAGATASGELESLIEERGLTSFILFEGNARDAAGLADMTSAAKDLARSLGLPGALFAADEEGGLISPLGAMAGRAPSPMALAAGGSLDRARRAAEHVGAGLAGAGLDLVLAPVLDVNVEPENPVIGTRSFGDDPRMVSDYGKAAIEGFRTAGLACCGKHFPGHGRASKDSHKTLPSVGAGAAEMFSSDLVPFREACAGGVDSIMTAHVGYPDLDGGQGLPSTLSKRIQTDILREELRFEGALISDSMEMKGLTDYLAPGDACVEALKAGVDLFICVDSELARACAERVEKALDAGEIDADILDGAFRNVLSLKERIGRAQTHATADSAALRECYAASITSVGSSPEELKSRVASARGGYLVVPDGLPGYGQVDTRTLEEEIGSSGAADRWRVLKYPFDPSDDNIARVISELRPGCATVLCTLSRGPGPVGQRRLVEAALDTESLAGAVALLDPYDMARLFPRGTPGFATYGFWPECLRALGEALFGSGRAPGVLPIDIERARC